jgi:hypothetical protein
MQQALSRYYGNATGCTDHVTKENLTCHNSDRDGGGEEDINKHEPNPALSFAEAHTVLQTVKSYFYARNISKRDENILNMKRM